MKSSGKTGKIFIAVIVLVHIIFFLLAAHFKRIYMGDSYEYVYMAINIKERLLFYSANAALPLMAKNFTLRPPVYSLFLLLVYVFTINNWVVIILQNLLSIFNILYCRKTLQLIGYNKKYDWVLLVLIVAYPAQFIFADTIAPDILLQTFVLVYCRHFILLTKERTMRHAWITIIALTLGIFTKPILILFIPVHVVMLLYVCIKLHASWRSFAPVIVPIACILLYDGWNYQRTDKFHFTSIQPMNALLYNVRMYQEQALGREAAKHYIDREKAKMYGMPSFKEWYDYGNETSKQFLKEHFFSYAWFHIKSSFQFFIHPGKGELDLFTGDLTYGRFFKNKDKRIMEVLKETPPSQWLSYMVAHPNTPAMFVVLFFNVLKVIGAVVFVFNRRIAWQYRSFLFIVLCYFALMTGPIANARYHLPVSLILIGCGALGYQRLLQGKRNSTNITI